MTRGPRGCPSCGEIFEPRRVNSQCWTKTCSPACAREAIAKAMRDGGSRKALAAKTYEPHIELTCEICGHKWKLAPSQVKNRRTCSVSCAAELKRRESSGKRKGTANPNYRNGSREGVRSRSDEQRWYAALDSRCANPACPGARGKLALHHCIYRQEVIRAGGDVWDPTNALTLCNGCHMSHHRRGHVLPLSVLPNEVFGFARRTLGIGPAYEYLRKRYAGDDQRLDALLAEWEQAA